MFRLHKKGFEFAMKARSLVTPELLQAHAQARKCKEREIRILSKKLSDRLLVQEQPEDNVVKEDCMRKAEVFLITARLRQNAVCE